MTFDNENEDKSLALALLAAAVSKIAKAFHICPICLTFHFADMISNAEDRGDIRHSADEDADITIVVEVARLQ